MKVVVHLEAQCPEVDDVVTMKFVPRVGDVITIDNYGHRVSGVFYRPGEKLSDGCDVLVRLGQERNRQ